MGAAKAKAPKAAGEAGEAKGGKKKLLLIAGVVLLLGGAAGGWFSGVIPRLLGRGGEAAAGEEHEAKGGQAEPHGGHGEAHAEKPAGHEKAGEKAGDKHGEGKEAKAEGKPGKGEPVFMDLPDIVANLNTGSKRAAFVKLKAKLELSKAEDQAALQAAMPRVLDLFQGFLREMRPEELRGTAGTYRLREELLARTNLVAPPARARAVLFTEMIVQ